MSAPQNLRLNLLKTPCHLRRSRLALSWAAPADQTAYRVVVAQGCANAEEGICVYDSGWVVSADSSSVRPAGMAEALKSGILYYARVAVLGGGERFFRAFGLHRGRRARPRRGYLGRGR